MPAQIYEYLYVYGYSLGIVNSSNLNSNRPIPVVYTLNTTDDVYVPILINDDIAQQEA
ncbi:MAG: hypothetical protein AB8G77_05570 [Rhodothermales bacterium]